ncbi:MAG: DUF4388 domain-containing protein [Geobacter sp.]|nr:DUF4388 domain-containing protein [Geobacter sp.]
MAFTGDLEHLPIVDLIQLLNSTRKTGVLTVNGRKGESQLVFKDGYIVSASHLNNSVRIGDVLIKMKFLTAADIEAGLKRQAVDGENRRPLAITLIELGLLNEENAYKALQHLIEMTVVEILTWKTGRFSLSHLKDVIDCDFRYYPEKMNHEVNVNTQSILMDALRIFDERMRDGLIKDEEDEPAADLDLSELISEDDLGLSDMETLSGTLPKSFKEVAVCDPIALQKAKLSELALDLPLPDIDRLAAFLAVNAKEGKTTPAAGQSIIIYSCDRLLTYSLETVLAAAGNSAVTVVSDGEIGKALENLENGCGWLVVDAHLESSQAFSKEKISSVRNSIAGKIPGVRIIQLSYLDDLKFAFDAYKGGAVALIPKPAKDPLGDFIEDHIALVGLLTGYISHYR